MIVIGAGIAGSTAAFRIQQAGHPVTLLEASDAVGGRTRTTDVHGFGVELGAIYLLNSYERTLAVLEDAGASDLIAPWSPTAGLWDGRRLHEIRYDFLPTFFKLDLMTVRDKIKLATGAARSIAGKAPEPFETDSLAEFDDGTDMETWARRRFGDNVFEYVVRPLIEPSFGSDCRDLSKPYLMGILKRAHKAAFRLPVDGMGRICEELTRDVDVRLNTAVTSVRRNGDQFVVTTEGSEQLTAARVVVATTSGVAGDLLGATLDAEQIGTLRDAPYASMAHSVLRWDRDPWPEHGLEMLLPVGAGARPLLGTIVKTGRTSRLVPDGARLMNSYFSSAATRAMSDEEIIDVALTHVRDIFGAGFTEPAASVVRFDVALATSPPGHYARMRELRAGLPRGLALAGDYLAHLGVETAVVSGERAAEALLRS